MGYNDRLSCTSKISSSFKACTVSEVPSCRNTHCQVLAWHSLMHNQEPHAAMCKPKLSSEGPPSPQLQVDPGSNAAINAFMQAMHWVPYVLHRLPVQPVLGHPSSKVAGVHHREKRLTCLGMIRVQMKKAPCFSSRTPARMPHDSTPLAVLRRE